MSSLEMGLGEWGLGSGLLQELAQRLGIGFGGGWDRSAVSLTASLVSVAAASPPASLAGEWLCC